MNPPSSQSIREYEEIDNLLISARREANTRVCRIHIPDVHSSQTIKMDQLRLRLANQLIKRRYSSKIIKLKMATNISYLNVSKCWIPPDTNSFILQKATAKQE